MNKLDKLREIRSKLKLGKISIGSWIQMESPSSAEIMGDSGYDWIGVDLEHGSISTSQLPNIFRALELKNTLPLARIAEGNRTNCKLCLDAGAAGVIIPQIETKNQLESLIKASKWPPFGNRGVGFSRANLYGKNFNEYKEEAFSPLIVAMIENTEGFNNLDEIISTNGLDAILIGPYDLSASLGFTGETNHPKVESAVNEILKKCNNISLPVGIHVVNPNLEELKHKIDKGFRFIAYSIDTVFLNNSCQMPKL